jgi:Leucine-rich repeat (LRR) protein
MSSNKCRRLSLTDTRPAHLPKPLSIQLAARFLDVDDLVSLATTTHHLHEDLRGFPIDLLDYMKMFTPEQLTLAFVRPNYWKLAGVNLRYSDQSLASLSSLSIYRLQLTDFTSLVGLESMTLVKEVTIHRPPPRRVHVCDTKSNYVLDPWTQLEHVTIYDHCLRRIPSLEKLPNIKSLDMSNCCSVTDWSPLGSESLAELDLSNCRTLTAGDLQNLVVFPAMHTLYLDGCDTLEAVPPLEHNTNLTYLSLSRCAFTDLCPLANTSIAELHCVGAFTITDLWPLVKMSGLRELDFSMEYPGRVVTVPIDWTPLGFCERLERLDISGRAIADLSVLGACANLQQLHLRHCTAVTTMTGLGTCARLTLVDLQHSSVTDVSDLISCTRLHVLDLSACLHLPLPWLNMPGERISYRIEGCATVTSFLDEWSLMRT